MLSGLFAWFEQHPVLAAVVIWAVDLVFVSVITLAAMALLPQVQPPDFVSLCVDTVVLLVVLTLLGWWRTVGFNRPVEWRDLRVLWLPAVVTIVLPFLMGAKALDAASAAFLVLGYALTGLREETLFRGIILRVLRPIGPVRAVVLSAVLFALAHAQNFLVRSPAIVLAQMVGAFCFGLAYAALRLRTNTLWFLIVLHALHDLLLRFSNFPLIPLDVVQDIILLIYAILLLRNRRALESAPAAEVAPAAEPFRSA